MESNKLKQSQRTQRKLFKATDSFKILTQNTPNNDGGNPYKTMLILAIFGGLFGFVLFDALGALIGILGGGIMGFFRQFN